MRQAELRERIIEYLERREGDMLRSVGMVAEAVGAERAVVHKLIRTMVKKGEVFEPIPRRYLRRERRLYLGNAPHVPERRKAASKASRSAPGSRGSRARSQA